jgi:cyclomaltodextrin glucanotransferase
LPLLAIGLTTGPMTAHATTRSLPADGHVDDWYSHTDGHPEALPAKNLGNELFYQVVIDRFANGNTANDCLDGNRFCDPSHRDWYRFWGGDLRGVEQHLPYLKNLGVTRLWLTPVFENELVTVPRVRYGENVNVTAYHGYWFRDWFRLNPYFTDHGSQDLVQVGELIDAAAPEIKIHLDTVANHTNPSDATAASLSYLDQKEPLSTAGGIHRTHRGALFRDGAYVTSLDDDLQQHGNGVGELFHHFGSISNWGDKNQVENFQLDGLTDLDQGSGVVRDYLRDAHDFWMNRFPGLGGYRMDTIKHVPQAYWRDFDRDFFAAHPDKAIVGEYFGGGPSDADSGTFYRSTHMTMFDFEFHYALLDVFLFGKGLGALSGVWRKDPALVDARELVTFLDNHDVARARGMGMTYPRLKQALAVLLTARGIPCLYYGIEQDLFHPNDPGDPFNRPMMASFDENHELYRMVQRLAEVRRTNGALRHGATHVVHQSDRILAYERVLGDERVLVAVSTNPIPDADRFDLQALSLPDGRYTDVLSGKTYAVSGGKMPVELRNGDVIVLSSGAAR